MRPAMRMVCCAEIEAQRFRGRRRAVVLAQSTAEGNLEKSRRRRRLAVLPQGVVLAVLLAIVAQPPDQQAAIDLPQCVPQRIAAGQADGLLQRFVHEAIEFFIAQGDRRRRPAAATIDPPMERRHDLVRQPSSLEEIDFQG